MKKPKHIGEKLQQEAEAMGLKPAQVAEVFDVRPPSVYDWYKHGRIAKKHYITLVQWSGRPIQWWLDIPATHEVNETAAAPWVDADPRHKVLTELFDSLPNKEQDELIRSLTEKKQHYDAVVDELLSRRQAH